MSPIMFPMGYISTRIILCFLWVTYPQELYYVSYGLHDFLLIHKEFYYFLYVPVESQLIVDQPTLLSLFTS